MLELLASCLTFDYIAVDTEGFTAETRLGTSICNPLMQAMYFPEGHKEQDVNIDAEVREALAYTLKTVRYRIFHHAGHDIVILPELADLPFICTMIMAHMIDENVMSKGLDYLDKYYCNGVGKQKPKVMQDIINDFGWEWVPFPMMNAYATVDAYAAMNLFKTIRPLYEAQFGPIWSNT